MKNDAWKLRPGDFVSYDSFYVEKQLAIVISVGITSVVLLLSQAQILQTTMNMLEFLNVKVQKR